MGCLKFSKFLKSHTGQVGHFNTPALFLGINAQALFLCLYEAGPFTQASTLASKEKVSLCL